MKVKRLKISHETLPGPLIQGQTLECRHGLPADAKLINWEIAAGQTLILTFEHPSFPDVTFPWDAEDIYLEFKVL